MSSRTWSLFAALKKIILCLGVGLFVMGCTRSEDAASSRVNLAIWGAYLHPELIQKFTAETGLKLNVTHYSSNEELLAKLQAGGSGWDVAVPSDYMVGIMIKMNLLEPIRPELAIREQLLPEFLKLDFDPENAFSLPYAGSFTGIAVRRDLYKGEIQSWKDVFENAELNGKLALLDDSREVTAAALRMRGQSVNSTDAAALEQARLDLMKVRPRVKMFTSDSIDILKNQEVAVAQAYSTDAMQAKAQTPEIDLIVPLEGTTKALDNLVIVKGSKNIEGAHRLIEFMLQPENYLKFNTLVRNRPVVKGVLEKLPDELRSHPAINPSLEMQKKLESLRDLGEKNRLFEDLWIRVKAGG